MTDASSEGGDAACWANLDERPLVLDDHALADLFRNLADAVIIADRGGIIRMWNDGAERLFGWSSAEALGQPLSMIVPERLRSRHDRGYERMMQTGETSYADRLLQVPALHREGKPLSIAFTVSLLHDAMRLPSGVAAVLRDDTANFELRRANRPKPE
ncbi:MAG: PAS domain S-box protein [Ilumatobacteraceae bacterium]